jgi:DNA-binding transcriptional regulator WhiA
MSFTSDVKDELAAIELSDNSKRAQLSALMQLLASLSISSSGLSLLISCSNAKVIKRIGWDIRALYGLRCDIEATKQKNLDSETSIPYALTKRPVRSWKIWISGRIRACRSIHTWLF